MWNRDFVAKMPAQDDLRVARAELAAEKQQREAAEQENARLREALTNASSLARAAEPVNGWGTRTLINDAWADGFRTACVEISDALNAQAVPPETEPT